MMPASTLEPVYQEYKITRDCFKVTLRAVRDNNMNILKNMDIIAETEQTIEACRERMDDLAVVALWAFFERRLIEFVQVKGNIIQKITPAPFADYLYEGIKKSIEYWKHGDILDLLKGNISPALLGQAKQIKKFRDWIVHRNPRSESIKTDPETAYDILSTILTSLEAI